MLQHRNYLLKNLFAGMRGRISRLNYSKRIRQTKRDSNLIDFELDEPHLWYKEARKMKRKIICHVGPTNSGKTYQALSTFKNAKSGIYCGPLRLLAWEIQDRMKTEGIKCNLITGNEKEIIENATHMSCTVEMVDVYKEYDIAIIDEVQMIGDEDRGWAWTQALLSVRAKEIHLCGSRAFINVVKKIFKVTEEEIIINAYERLQPLKITTNFYSFRDIREGDALIGFSRKSLYDIKRKIEQTKGIKCCVIYGSLPPKARQDQAKLFSDPKSKYSCLVASDAIGMGLNLAIRRIIFTSMTKFDGTSKRLLYPQEVKQIAGRAGRFKSEYDEGEVTCLNDEDTIHLRNCMGVVDNDIKRAGLFPTEEHIHMLSLIDHYSLTKNMLMDFWIDYFSNGDSDISIYERQHHLEVNDFSDRNWRSIDTIIKHFQTMDEFEITLMDFLESHPDYNEFVPTTYSRDKIIVNEKIIEDFEDEIVYQPPPRTSSNFNGSDSTFSLPNSVNILDKEPYIKPGLRDILHKRLTSSNKSAKKPPKIKYGERRIVRLTTASGSLERALTLFKSEILFKENNFYFLCKIESAIGLAKILDDYRDTLSLSQRFALCKAPASSDDPEVYNKFKRFIDDLCSPDKTVYCPEYLTKDSRPATTEVELLEYESIHQILDLYTWLAMRLPKHFVDFKLASEQSDLCSEIIGKSLVNQSLSSTRHNRKKYKKDNLYEELPEQ